MKCTSSARSLFSCSRGRNKLQSWKFSDHISGYFLNLWPVPMVRLTTFLSSSVGAHTYAVSLHAIRGALLPSGPGSCVMQPLMWTAALCLTSFGSFFCVRWHQCRLASRSRQSLRALICALFLLLFPSLKGQWRRRRVKPLRYLPNNPFPHFLLTVCLPPPSLVCSLICQPVWVSQSDQLVVRCAFRRRSSPVMCQGLSSRTNANDSDRRWWAESFLFLSLTR